MFLKLITICATLVGAVSLAQADNGFGRIWTADSHYYNRYSLVLNKPKINNYGDFRRLKHDHLTAIGFCRELGYYGTPSWQSVETITKHDRWMWNGFAWVHSNGRNYISTLICNY